MDQDFQISNSSTWNSRDHVLQIRMADGRDLSVRQEDIFGLSSSPLVIDSVPEMLRHGSVSVDGHTIDYFYMGGAGDSFGGSFKNSMLAGYADQAQAWADTRSWTPIATRINPATGIPYGTEEVAAIYGDIRARQTADHPWAAKAGEVVGTGVFAATTVALVAVAPIAGGEMAEAAAGRAALARAVRAEAAAETAVVDELEAQIPNLPRLGRNGLRQRIGERFRANRDQMQPGKGATEGTVPRVPEPAVRKSSGLATAEPAALTASRLVPEAVGPAIRVSAAERAGLSVGGPAAVNVPLALAASVAGIAIPTSDMGHALGFPGSVSPASADATVRPSREGSVSVRVGKVELSAADRLPSPLASPLDVSTGGTGSGTAAPSSIPTRSSPTARAGDLRRITAGSRPPGASQRAERGGGSRGRAASGGEENAVRALEEKARQTLLGKGIVLANTPL